MNPGLTLGNSHDFDSATGVSNFAIPLTGVPVNINDGQVTLKLNNFDSKILLEGTFPFTLVSSLQVTLPAPIGTVNLPLLGFTLLPVNATIRIYKDVIAPANQIYSVTQSINDPIINATVPAITFPAIATPAELTAFLNSIADVLTINDILPFQWVDDPNPNSCVTCCSAPGPNCCAGITDVNYFVTIEATNTIGTGVEITNTVLIAFVTALNVVLTALGLANITVNDITLVSNLTLLSNYSVAAEEVSE